MSNETQDLVDRFYQVAEEHSKMKFWNDDHLNGDKALGVQDSSVIVAFLDDAYFKSKKCKTEINYAESLDKEIIFVKLQQDLELLGRGSISLIASTKLCVRI